MIAGSKIRLREKRLSDVQGDYSWQVDRDLAELDAVSVLKMTFSQFLGDYASELRFSFTNSQRFAIETLDGKHIGNCAYYGIDETKGEAEVGIMIGNRNYWDKGYGTDVMTALVNHIFRHTKLKRLHLKTLVWNARAQSCFQKCGFTPYQHVDRDGHSFILMELHREQWEKNQPREAAHISGLAGETTPGR